MTQIIKVEWQPSRQRNQLKPPKKHAFSLLSLPTTPPKLIEKILIFISNHSDPKKLRESDPTLKKIMTTMNDMSEKSKLNGHACVTGQYTKLKIKNY